MRTIAFYSYKGGVGRSMSVAHTAYWLGLQKQSVFMLDMDMEAPGLHYKIEKFSKPVSPELGLVDYIGHFRREGKAIESLKSFVLPLESKAINMPPSWLMPAGNPFRTEYWQQLSQVEWKEFLYGDSKEGSLLFLELKAHIEKEYNPDFLLIDSRTGLTDLTGIGLELLADEAIVMGVNNEENIDGSRIVMERLRRRSKLPIKEAKTRIHFALTRIPPPLSTGDLEREERIKQQVLGRLNAGSGLASKQLVSKVNVIHIDADQALEERNRFMEVDWSKYPILKDYQRLVFEMTGLGMESGGLSFWDLHEEFEFEKDKARKDDLGRKLMDWRTTIAEQEVAKGSIAFTYLEDFPIAHKNLTQAIKLRPNDSVTYIQRSLTNLSMLNFQDAISDGTKAIELDSNSPLGHFVLGFAFSQSRQYKESIPHFQNAIRLGYPNAYGPLSMAFLNLEDYSKAIEAADFAIEISPSSSTYRFRSIAHFFLRNYDLAYNDTLSALDLSPGDSDIRLIQAEIFAAKGDLDSFFLWLEKRGAEKPEVFAELAPETIERVQHDPRFEELKNRFKA